MRSFFDKLFSLLMVKKPAKIAECVLPFIQDKDVVLDLGCGTGEIAQYLKDRKKIKIHLLEITDKYNKTSLKVEVYEGDRIPYKDSYFNCVLVIFVLHHSNNPYFTLSEAVRVSKDRLIVFEDKFNNRLGFWLITGWHTFVNFLTGETLSFTFISGRELKKWFKGMGLRMLVTKEIRLPACKPTKLKMHVLTKRKRFDIIELNKNKNGN